MKLLIIANHLSTGGAPQFTLKKIELLKDIPNIELYVIEYRQIAVRYVVQRNKIIELVGDNFISLGRHFQEEKRNKFEHFFDSISPDIVHLEEIPELFMEKDHADYVYKKDRNYNIFETTHTSTFNVNEKKYLPDKFLFVSEYSKNQYSKFNIPSEIIEYPIDVLYKDKNKYIKELNLDPNYFHVLNVGLFTKDKNQGYIFEIAKKLKNHKIKFHFVGNQAENFKDYWKPLNDKKLDNCIIWGEREDVYKFYNACDLLFFPSKLELNPLVVKEALSYNMPIFMNKLDVLGNIYDDETLVTYLNDNVDYDVSMLLSKFNIKKKYTNSLVFKNKLIDIYNKNKVNIKVNFDGGAKVEITGGDKDKYYGIEFINNKTKTIEYSSKIKTNHWSATTDRYYKDWTVLIFDNDKLLVKHDINLEGKNVFIEFDTRSLGDNLAFIPYVEEFRRKHKCNLICSTFWNELYENEYKDIFFTTPGCNINLELKKFKLSGGLYAKYNIGWYQPWESKNNPNDYKKIPLQQTATDILDLNFEEIKPNVTIKDGVRPIKEKYVCLAEFSTASAKHWHFPYKDSNIGWQVLVNWLNAQGYKVMVISKQKTGLKNIIDMTGDFPIKHRINQLKHCEFFVGVGSGLSWLAWAINKKVVMISGFSDPICEFKNNNIRIHNKNVCNSCFNRYQFDRGDWNWCPDHKDTERQFECTIKITPSMVIDEIKKSKLVKERVKLSDVDYDKYYENIFIDTNKIITKKNGNRINIKYDRELPELNIDLIDSETNKVLQTILNAKLSNKYFIWAEPPTNIENKKIKLRFHKGKTFAIINL